MADYKHLTSHTKEGLTDHISNDPDYVYQIHVWEDGKVVTRNVTVADLWDKDMARKYNTKLGAGGQEWDSDLIELGHDEDYIRKAVPIILEALENPNFSWVKDPGKDKFGRERSVQTKEVTGKRQVLFDLHTDANGGHLHLKLFRYAIDEEKKTATDAPMYVADVQRALFAQINQALMDNGLAPISNIFNAVASGNQRISQETKVQTQELAQFDEEESTVTIEDKIEKYLTDVAYDDSAIAKQISSDEKEMARLMEAMKNKQAEINQKKKALSVVNDNRALAYENKKLNEQNTELVQANEELLANNANLENDVAQKETMLFEQGNQIQTLIEQVKEKEEQLREAEDLQAQSDEDLQQKQILIDSLSGELSTLKSHVNALTAEKAQVENTLSIRDSQLEQANGSIIALQEATKAKDSQIELQKELNKQLQEKFEAQMAEQKRLFEAQISEQKRNFDSQIAEQHKEIEAVKSQLADKTKENSILKDFVKVVEEKLEQATTLISSLSSKLKAGQKAFISAFVEDTKQVAEFNKNLEDTNDEKAKKLAELQNLFKKNKEGVDSFTEQQKLEQNKAPRNTGGTDTPPKKK